MGLVFSIYKVSGIGLHSEVKAIWLAGFDGNISGGFIERAGGLKRCILVDRNADSVIVGGVSWRD